MLTDLDKKRGFRGLIVLFLAALIAITIGNYNQKTRNDRISYLEDNCDYTIGTIISYDPRTIVGIGNGGPQSIGFSYLVNGSKYETQYTDNDYPVPENYGPKSGEKFIAIYLAKEPNKCALLFNCPVKDSTDYKAYLGYFKNHRPKLEKR